MCRQFYMNPWLFLSLAVFVFSHDYSDDEDCTVYRDTVWKQNLIYTAYNQYRKGWHERQQRIRLYKAAQDWTTPYPRLATVFFEDGAKPDPKANYLSLSEAFGPPHTVDDDIGLPLNQPVNKVKTSFHRYYPYYNPYYYPRIY